MFDFAQLWADYAVYMPAIQRYYARFIHRTPASPPLAAGIDNQDLDFLSRGTALFKLPAALYSAGVVMEGRSERLLRPLDDMVGLRDPSTSYALADSGGFQIISAGLGVTDILRRRQLRWSERNFDAALPVDVPSAAVHKKGNPYFGRFDLALKDSLRSLDVFDKEHDGSGSTRTPADPLVRLVPFQGHTPAEAQAWYAAIVEQGYLGRFDGVAWGGAMRFDMRHVLRRLLDMDEAGLLERVRHVHFLGTSNIGYSLFLTSLKRALAARLGRDVSVTFDTATPFLYGYRDRKLIHGIDWSAKLPRLAAETLEDGAMPSDAKPAPLVGSELGRKGLLLGDLRRRGNRYSGWDEPGRLLLCNHNVEMACRAIILANQIADLEDRTVRSVPLGLRNGRRAIERVFSHPSVEAARKDIAFHSSALGMFARVATDEDDRD